MSILILSGVGGSTNWLPLIFPLVGIVIVLKTVEFTIQFVKRIRLNRQMQLAHQTDSHETAIQDYSSNDQTI